MMTSQPYWYNLNPKKKRLTFSTCFGQAAVVYSHNDSHHRLMNPPATHNRVSSTYNAALILLRELNPPLYFEYHEWFRWTTHTRDQTCDRWE